MYWLLCKSQHFKSTPKQYILTAFKLYLFFYLQLHLLLAFAFQVQASDLVKILDNITFVDVTTVALYVREIFDRLFLLLSQFEAGVDLQNDVFCVLIQCIGRLVGSRSNVKHQEAVDVYIDELFGTENNSLYKILVDQATDLMQWLDAIDGEVSANPTHSTKQRRTISAMMRCFEYVVRFAIRAGVRAHAMSKTDGIDGK